MTLQFHTVEQRDAMATRLSELATKLSKTDRYDLCYLAVNDRIVEDVRHAAYIIGLMEIMQPPLAE